MGRYLTTRALEGLREYAYKPSGYTILDAWHAPILNRERGPEGAVPWQAVAEAGDTGGGSALRAWSLHPPGRCIPLPLTQLACYQTCLIVDRHRSRSLVCHPACQLRSLRPSCAPADQPGHVSEWHAAPRVPSMRRPAWPARRHHQPLAAHVAGAQPYHAAGLVGAAAVVRRGGCAPARLLGLCPALAVRLQVRASGGRGGGGTPEGCATRLNSVHRILMRSEAWMRRCRAAAQTWACRRGSLAAAGQPRSPARCTAASSRPQPPPPGLPPCSAFAVFFYLHMDNLDGKQARRTKNSSPLGQLFDHGEGARPPCCGSTADSRCRDVSQAGVQPSRQADRQAGRTFPGALHAWQARWSVHDAAQLLP